MILTILCGSPGSGKTTLSKKLAEETNATRYSFDELGCLKHDELIAPIVRSLLDGEDVVVDALYVCLTTRQTLLKAISHIDCKRVLLYMDTSLEECIRRNAQRQRPLSSEFVKGIYNSIQLPTLSEGWDEIIYMKEFNMDESILNSIKTHNEN